ncbi:MULTISPECIES: acyltransferase family protein [unclassified Pseudomonas]|uniref:acyltransferase family protein n=1 Tax=unclassified Pseudomonas TaxID=196821 RepID=UPI001F439591|nr:MULTISPECIES: acyltransferase [unclassified Pseudomonas]MCF5233790.1 acyltransferase family protein [Pseudomonas sp. PA-5-4H]MCF5236406.1 acyltransferase family protein [Pseudomonas sp. PA-5-4G]MCF5251499.1 acyltransferase family protein [Pseudomonas sp. PA-5-4B]MCF5255028.1 acyltransferase family protein [Pseudomonas sp. PA-5-4B]MCF5263136.1 acyltransferase family protein [Pseudomonas sp. PA-5-4A]
MLGILRFCLASLVIIAHLGDGIHFVEHWGIFAVFGFYLISGYLITIILNTTYSFNFSSFATNRFLRLFPIYYAVVIITLIAMAITPNPSQYHNAWTFAGRPIDVIGNILIFPFEFYDSSFRMVPPSWSVAVELVNYFMLWLFVARSKNLAIATLLLSAAYHISTFALDMDWTRRYFPFYAALLPFSLGACIYFLKDYAKLLTTKSIKVATMTALLAWAINLTVCGAFSGLGQNNFNTFFYINLFSSAALVYLIANSNLQYTFKKSGKLLGDLAYPMFLLHWVAGFIMSYLILDGQRRGLLLVAVSFLPILVVSYCLSWLANRWLEPLRNIVRGQATTTKHSIATESS